MIRIAGRQQRQSSIEAFPRLRYSKVVDERAFVELDIELSCRGRAATGRASHLQELCAASAPLCSVSSLFRCHLPLVRKPNLHFVWFGTCSPAFLRAVGLESANLFIHFHSTRVFGHASTCSWRRLGASGLVALGRVCLCSVLSWRGRFFWWRADPWWHADPSDGRSELQVPRRHGTAY